ncbi:MAG: ABC transporter permease [Proteobacteria bacterium]|nr:ABC transporter permease [Pseudomonadota bacterium]MDA1012370.1 ABC transporter permease [Pseudomonadota bacterium]
MFWNSFTLAVNAIKRNLLRSFLTVLGIIIGVAAVITMVTVGRGATQSVSDQISAMGTNQLIVRPGQRRGSGANTPKFKQKDVDLIKTQVTGITGVAPYSTLSATVIFQAKNYTTLITGTTNDFFTVGNWVLQSGRQFYDNELNSGKASCILGTTVKNKLFGKENPQGKRIRVKQFTCEVIGVLESKGQSTWGTDQDDKVLMPLKTVHRRLLGSLDIERMAVKVADSNKISIAQAKITELIRQSRRLPDNMENDFRVLDMRQIIQTLTGTTRVLTMLLGAVAAVSLLVGGIGIMNIMLVSVTERTKEIGIRLAIGALEKHVLMQFLIEAVVLSSIGGVLGLILAAGLSIFGASLMGVPFIFDLQINILAFLFAASIGILFGFVPARRAARLNPIDALRHE